MTKSIGEVCEKITIELPNWKVTLEHRTALQVAPARDGADEREVPPDREPESKLRVA